MGIDNDCDGHTNSRLCPNPNCRKLFFGNRTYCCPSCAKEHERQSLPDRRIKVGDLLDSDAVEVEGTADMVKRLLSMDDPCCYAFLAELTGCCNAVTQLPTFTWPNMEGHISYSQSLGWVVGCGVTLAQDPAGIIPDDEPVFLLKHCPYCGMRLPLPSKERA